MSTSQTKLLTSILIILVIVISVRYYLKPAPNVKIIQIELAQFDTKLLLDKNPIVIEDQVVSIEQFIKASFRYIYSFDSKISFQDSSIQWKQNKGRYMLIHNAEILHIAHPNQKSSPNPSFIDIKVMPKQIVILPCMWMYRVKRGTAHILYDIPSMFLFPFV